MQHATLNRHKTYARLTKTYPRRADNLFGLLAAAEVAFDYRGFGRSSGKPSERGVYLDAEAAFEWLRSRDFGATNIVVLGESLGGGVVCELATRKQLQV